MFVKFLSEAGNVRCIEVFGDDEDWAFKRSSQLNAGSPFGR